MSRRHSLLFACAVLLLSSVKIGAQTAPPVAPAPALMNFQGRLTRPDGTPVADGAYSVQFAFYDAVTDGNRLWTQTLASVAVRNGSFAALLTVDAPNLFNGNLWLELKIGTDAPLAPRQQIVSVAYAQKANTVPDGSITGAKIAAGSITGDKFAASFGGIPSGYSILGATPAPPPGYTYFGQTIVSSALLDAWTTKAPLLASSGPRAGAAVVALNNQLYIIGSLYSGDAASSLIAYNPITDSYTALAYAPGTLTAGQAAAAALNGKIYYLLGGPIFVYDPATNTWTVKAQNPLAQSSAACAAVNGKIYSIGGLSGYQSVTGYVSAYDPMNDSWTILSSMPTPRAGFAVAVFNNKIYTFGGYTYVNNGQTGNVQTASNAAQVYDPATNTWAILPNLPTARYHPGCAVLNNKIYVLGGYVTPANSAPTVLGTNEEYDPTAGTYATRANMKTPRWRVGAASLFNNIYTFGGLTAPNNEPLSSVNEAYTPNLVLYVHTKN